MRTGVVGSTPGACLNSQRLISSSTPQRIRQLNTNRSRLVCRGSIERRHEGEYFLWIVEVGAIVRYIVGEDEPAQIMAGDHACSEVNEIPRWQSVELPGNVSLGSDIDIGCAEHQIKIVVQVMRVLDGCRIGPIRHALNPIAHREGRAGLNRRDAGVRVSQGRRKLEAGYGNHYGL